jgi:TolB protein
MDADGSDVRRLTDGPTDETLPTWSPDGSHLTFMTTSESSWRIAVMRSDGTGRTLLPGVDDGAPYWGPGD